ncbi:hypothetical protein [Isoalcanivorax indicus]|uniref:hypothetical protein n=1 Tax=Isoalcanivorax indicus TaxID=2202653 RepID=UPI0013C50692|nr:hypothetical protein [Isoalcanivorax indicus]
MRHQDLIREQFNDNRMMTLASLVMLVIILVSIGLIVLAGGQPDTVTTAMQVQHDHPAH